MSLVSPAVFIITLPFLFVAWSLLRVILSYLESLPLIFIGLFPLRIVLHRVSLSKRSLQALQQLLFDYIPLQWTAIEMVSLGITWVNMNIFSSKSF